MIFDIVQATVQSYIADSNISWYKSYGKKFGGMYQKVQSMYKYVYLAMGLYHGYKEEENQIKGMYVTVVFRTMRCWS